MAKRKVRYRDGFTEHEAKNRNLQSERKALEAKGICHPKGSLEEYMNGEIFYKEE